MADTGLHLVDGDEKPLEQQQQEHFDAQAEFSPAQQVRCPRAPYEFEGINVEDTSMKVMSATGQGIDGRRLKIDDWVEIKVIGRVSSVDHKYTEKDNQTVRVHTVKVVEVEFERSYSPAHGIEYT